MKKRTKFILIPFILIGVVLCVILFPVVFLRAIGLPDYIRNNLQLNRFANNLYSYPLPPGSRVQSRTSTVTLLGNSNHCDFVAEQTIMTGLSLSELEAYYEDVTFPPVRSEKQGYEDSFASGIHGEVRPHIEPVDEHVLSSNQAFKIRLVDFGYPPGWDFRCH